MDYGSLLQVSLISVTYADNMRMSAIFVPIVAILAITPLLAMGGEIFTRDGVTDGDTFYLAPQAEINNDPAYQSWVTYSLIKSTCQLNLESDNPARANSFDCEFRSRRQLANAWEEKRQADNTLSDAYLDTLTNVQFAGFLAEYTAVYFGKRGWELPDGLRLNAFADWRKTHLRGHRPKTRITGSWNYKSRTTIQQD